MDTFNIVWLSIFIVVAIIALIHYVKQPRNKPLSLTYEDWEFIEFSINGQDMPPANIAEIILPTANRNCYAIRGTFWGKDSVMWFTGAVKIVALPKEKKSDGG